MIGERVLGLPPEPRVDRDVLVPRVGGAPCLSEPQSYRINEEPDQVRREQDRLRMLARVADGRTRRALADVGIAPGWHCCDVGSGAGTVAAWMAEQVGPSGRVVSLDVDTRFQPPSAGVVEVRTLDVTSEPIGDERVRSRARARACSSISRSGRRCSTR